MILTVIEAPLVEPVSVSEAKDQLRIEQSFALDDEYIGALISASRERCEAYCNNFFSVQDIKVTLNCGGEIYRGLAISEVLADGVATTNYEYDELTGFISFSDSAVKYVITAETSAPKGIAGVKQAIKMMVTDLYELRTETVVGTIVADNQAVKSLLFPFRTQLIL